ncbi:hypothetical protein Pisl_1993 [Pyrobaculum islandicum DSM 4184]|uniref:Uncharacterized protein n=1 Tax=Pyrobaculum islandicum (strain DSM 4184 / JCM 9189 / GEO3) TaxID=384616 RepID=A1RW08_PYRIL|nr:hypothetical protein [Pyrobaculum islandicum]ABL89140.1 hypothetical protein Pisl_1993 [Pyrobaculum islandicum DSM 4184]
MADVSFETAFKAVELQYAKLRGDLDKLLGEIPEAVDGLSSLYEATEDYTCFTAKKLLGRRDKGAARSVL